MPISSRSSRSEHDALVTIEENVVAGGAGSAVAEALAAAGIVVSLLQLGIARRASSITAIRRELLADCGLDAAGIVGVGQRPVRAAPDGSVGQAGGLTPGPPGTRASVAPRRRSFHRFKQM